MRLSQYFLPTLKETPAEAQIASHRLMLRSGMINQTAAGIYSWLPLGLRVLQNIEKIVAEEQDKIGCHRVLMPTLQPASLWQESGRYDDYGKEMLRIKDRHERDMLYGPTNEEVITDIVRQYIKSYRQLPQTLYQISWKFRDEIRPRFGVMRGREFLMKDGYSFDVSEEAAAAMYDRIFGAYMRLFNRLGLHAMPVRADTGPIGGKLSHEFHILASNGESGVFYDPAWENVDTSALTLKDCAHLYAATDDLHDPKTWTGKPLMETKGIEVGHIFTFGTRYSNPMQAKVTLDDGTQSPVIMGSYGLGVGRLVGAMIEACHDDKGIIWPESVAPYRYALINLGTNDAQCIETCDGLYHQLGGRDAVLYDDRDVGMGVKLNDADLIGLPTQIVVGPRDLKEGLVQVKNRKTGEKRMVAVGAIKNLSFPQA
jgi:prolyl-tRNA synthetase